MRLLLIPTLILFLNVVLALDVGIDGDIGIDLIPKPSTAVNYSVQNTNSSEYWDGLDTPADIDHNDLFGLQGGGGEGTEYYHLSQIVHDSATSLLETSNFADNTLTIGDGINLKFLNGNITTTGNISAHDIYATNEMFCSNDLYVGDEMYIDAGTGTIYTTGTMEAETSMSTPLIYTDTIATHAGSSTVFDWDSDLSQIVFHKNLNFTYNDELLGESKYNIFGVENISADYYFGDGSQLTGISGGIWTNNSGTAHYNNDVNISQNLSVHGMNGIVVYY